MFSAQKQQIYQIVFIDSFKYYLNIANYHKYLHVQVI